MIESVRIIYYFNIVGTVVGTLVCLLLIYIAKAQRARSDFNRLVSHMAGCEFMNFLVFFNTNLFFDYPNISDTIDIVFFYLYSFQIYFIACSYIISAIISFMLYVVISSQIVLKIDDYKYSLLAIVFLTNLLWFAVSVYKLYKHSFLDAYHGTFFSYYVILVAIAFNVAAYLGCLAKVRKMGDATKSEQFQAIVALIDRYKWYPIIQVFGR